MTDKRQQALACAAARQAGSGRQPPDLRTVPPAAAQPCAVSRALFSDTSVTTARNRHETRSADVFSATRAVAGPEWKSLVKSIVRVTREVLHRDAKTDLWSSTSEVAYYVANSAVSACLAATAIRHHWNVENTLHYTRDVTFQAQTQHSTLVANSVGRLMAFPHRWRPPRDGELTKRSEP